MGNDCPARHVCKCAVSCLRGKPVGRGPAKRRNHRLVAARASAASAVNQELEDKARRLVFQRRPVHARGQHGRLGLAGVTGVQRAVHAAVDQDHVGRVVVRLRIPATDPDCKGRRTLSQACCRFRSRRPGSPKQCNVAPSSATTRPRHAHLDAGPPQYVPLLACAPASHSPNVRSDCLSSSTSVLRRHFPTCRSAS